MQVPDEAKRSRILAKAAEMFAAQPFHKVRLSDVAEAAAVGKGTLYIYFRDKEDLYLSVLHWGFSRLLDRLREKMGRAGQDPFEKLAIVICEIVRFAFRNPRFFELMRTAAGRSAIDFVKWGQSRDELQHLIKSIIQEGIDLGKFVDPHPEITARFIPGLVRSALMGGIDAVDQKSLEEHVLRFVRAGLTMKNAG